MSNNSKRWLIAGCISMLFILMIPFTAFAAALGMGPPNIEINDAMPGHQYEDIIFLQYGDSTEGIIELSATGDISEWVSFYNLENSAIPIENIVAPVGEWINVRVKFTIPGDAIKSTTNGTLVAKTVAPEAESGMSVGLKTSIDVTIHVIREGEVINVAPSVLTDEPSETTTYIAGDSAPSEDPTSETTSTSIAGESNPSERDALDSSYNDADGESAGISMVLVISIASVAGIALGILITETVRRKLMRD